jgi:hypothetical protein
VALRAVVAGCALLVLGRVAPAQAPPQAYLDDSTLAIETLAQLDELLRAGSLNEAARALQRLLDEQGDRLSPSREDPALFVTVREAVQDRLLGDASLLRAYTLQQNPVAAGLLAEGRHREVEHARFLTDAGFEATLRVAQERLEHGLFESAWRVLRALGRHPLFGEAPYTAIAASLARTVASFVGRAEVSAEAARWARRAGLPGEPPPPAERPAWEHEGDLDPLGPAPAGELRGIVPTPLHAAPLPSSAMWSAPGERYTGPRVAWSMPALLDTMVLVNDGDAVMAFERFTLRPLWRAPLREGVDPDSRTAQRLRGRMRMIEDPAMVTASDRVVLAPMGLVVSGMREGETGVLCLDRATGRVRWSVDPATLSRELFGGSVRGPVAVDGDTALVTLRKNERSRRTIGVYLAGLSLEDGSLRWARLLGSVGALPYQQQTRSPQATLVHRGLAFVADEIGLVAAIDSATGRPLWVRRTQGLGDQGGQPQPWAVHRPVADGSGIVTLSPDRAGVLRLDGETGRVLSRRSASELGGAVYLLDGGEHLAAVGPSSIRWIRRGTLGDAGPEGVDIAGTHGVFVGRVVVSGGVYLAPVESGVLMITPGTPPEPELLRLDASGTIAVGPGQIVVADDARVRSYLAWDVASGMLRERIESSPEDPDPAVTYTELAHRAGRLDEILPAMDLALRAIERGGPRASGASARLFDSTLEIIETAQQRWQQPDAGEAPAPSTALVGQLIDRLGRIADSAEQRVAYLLATGRQFEATSDWARAASSYQSILEDERLAESPWRGARLSVRAELEGERRLHALVRRAGAGVYAPFDERARGELARLEREGSAPEAFARLARAFPLSPASVAARLHESTQLRAAGDERQAIRAGSRAIESAQRLEGAGVEVDRGLVGRVYGSQVVALARANRVEEAGLLADEARRGYPGLTLMDGGVAVDTAGLFEDIARRLATRRLRPRLGPALVMEDEPQIIRGYPLRPLVRPEPGGVARARFDGALIVSPAEGTLAWHAPESADSAMREVWTRRIDRDPLLLRIDASSAWLFWPAETGGWLERIALEDGESMWVSAPWDVLVRAVPIQDAGEPFGGRARFLDPIDGRVRAEELLLTMDARTIVLIERGGRAAGVDAGSGEVLWASALPLQRVHDADTVGSVCALGGVGRNRLGEFGPVIATIDPRTGEAIHLDDSGVSEVRWLRLTGGGDLIAGLTDRLVCVSPAEGRLNWDLATAQTGETGEAWIVGERLLFRGTDDELWSADLQTGRLPEGPFETRGRFSAADRIAIETRGEGVGGGVVLSSSQGVCLFDADGGLVGMDAFARPATLLPAAISEDRIAVLQIERGRFGLGGTRFVLHLLEHGSARVVSSASVRLFGEPATIEAIDGRILIAAGEATVVLRTGEAGE